MKKKIETRKKFGRICALVVVGMFVMMTLSTSVSAPPPIDWSTGGNVAAPGDILGTLNHEDLRIFTDGTQKMVVTTDGCVGIGMRSPPFPESYLHVEPSWGTLGKTIFQAISPDDPLYMANDVAVIRAGPLPYMGTVLRVESVMVDSEDYALLNVQNDALGIQSSKLYVRGDGNVGIGTTSPTEALDVVGNIHASGSLLSGNSITIDGTNDKITASGGTINFDDENLITTGKVGIGTTSPTGKLHVVDSSGTYAGYFDAGSSGGISDKNMPVGVAAVAKDGIALVAHANGALSLTNLATNLGTSHISVVGTNAWWDGVGCYFEGRKYSGYFNEADVIVMDGNLGIRTESPTSALDVNGNDIRIRQSQTPPSSSADGYTGEIAWDQNAIYVCTNGDGPGGGTDTWKRASISTW